MEPQQGQQRQGRQEVSGEAKAGGGGAAGGEGAPAEASDVPVFKSALRSMATSHVQQEVLRCKLVVVGDAHVGKTALSQMFHSGGQQYPKLYVMTIGVDFSVKQVAIPNTNTIVEMHIFDCAGQSVFNQIDLATPNYQNTSYMVLVFDVSNRDSFRSCAKWLKEVRSTRPQGSPPVPGVLIANKIDLRAGPTPRAVVTPEESTAFAEAEGLAYFECSAAEATNVDAPFMFVAEQFREKYERTVEEAQMAAAGGESKM